MEQIRQENSKKNLVAHSAKECAYLAVFVSLTIAIQAVLSMVPGVELVTVLFVTYAFVMGPIRGMIAATAFTFLRQIIFGFYPTVFALYIIYFNLLTACFGLMGRFIKNPLKTLPLIVVIACICTVCFTMIDNILTPLWLGYGKKSTMLYFKASLPFMIPQVICTAISVTALFIPLRKVFSYVKSKL